MIDAATPINRGDVLTAPNGSTSRVVAVRRNQVMLCDPDGSRFVANREHMPKWTSTRPAVDRDRNPNRTQPATTRFAVAVEAASLAVRRRVAEGLGMSIGQLRRRAHCGWAPAPMARAQVAAALGLDPAELFADQGDDPKNRLRGPRSTAVRAASGKRQSVFPAANHARLGFSTSEGR